jgi:hypothetical protein
MTGRLGNCKRICRKNRAPNKNPKDIPDFQEKYKKNGRDSILARLALDGDDRPIQLSKAEKMF